MKQYRVFIDITVTKTFSISAESEEQAKEQALKQCRERSDYYARNNDGVIDVSVSDCEECTEPEDDDLGTSDLREAVAYVREQLGEDRLAVVRAQANVCYEQRRTIDTDYNDEVHDLLEEWGEEHDLCEEWWSESIELEDIIVRL